MEQKKLGHLMLDLETLGDKSNAAILSIAAVEFNIETGEMGREFYEKIDLESCINIGLKINASTFYWWMNQSEESRKEICMERYSIKDVLLRLKSFMESLGNFQIWGNGARFDIGILENAYIACGYQSTPWNFKNERDVRTLVSFFPSIKEQHPFKGIRHNSLDDCKHQISYCHLIWKKIIKM